MSGHPNRMTMGQKRAVGKKSPLSKRPKLDFFSGTNDQSASGRMTYNTMDKENPKNAVVETKGAATSDWDDEDFCGDMLEKVCLIADLSQAIVNEDADILQNLSKDKPMLNSKKPHKNNNKLPNNRELNFFDELERLKAENDTLKDNFKTKEGEVQILRSQIKQYQDSKQTEVVHNMKVLEEVQQKYQDKLTLAEKECQSVRTRLQFKDLEMKSLRDRCKQMESSTSKIKLVEPEAMHMDCRKSLFNSTQGPVSAKKSKIDRPEVGKRRAADSSLHFTFPTQECHDGKLLAGQVSPELFATSMEPDVISLYPTIKGSCSHLSRLDFDKREKYRWSGLPQQTVFFREVLEPASRLFLFSDLASGEAKPCVDHLLQLTMAILSHENDLLGFLNELQKTSNDLDNPDQRLLDNEDKVVLVTRRMALCGDRLNEEECGIDCRRALALLASVLHVSSGTFAAICRIDLLTLIKSVVERVGELKRPVRYAGLLIASVFILEEIIQHKEIEREHMSLVENMFHLLIYARPRLDVLREVIRTLQLSGRHHTLVSSLCRTDSMASCVSLCMDSKLRQTWFVTENTCPLKMLCIELMGQACQRGAAAVRCDVTHQIIQWLHLTLDSPCQPAWLEKEGVCFDVTKLLVFMLNLCVQDYKTSQEGNNRELLRVIGDGPVLLRRILKPDDRILDDSSQQRLRFALDLTRLQAEGHFSHTQKDAIAWMTELVDVEVKSIRQSTNKVSTNISAFKIKDTHHVLS